MTECVPCARRGRPSSAPRVSRCSTARKSISDSIGGRTRSTARGFRCSAPRRGERRPRMMTLVRRRLWLETNCRGRRNWKQRFVMPVVRLQGTSGAVAFASRRLRELDRRRDCRVSMNFTRGVSMSFGDVASTTTVPSAGRRCLRDRWPYVGRRWSSSCGGDSIKPRSCCGGHSGKTRIILRASTTSGISCGRHLKALRRPGRSLSASWTSRIRSQ